MTGPAIVLVKGISGSGKSTRVYLFLSWLESIGEKFTPYTAVIDGKQKEIGIYCESFNLIAFGKFYEKGGVKRWQGLDSVTGKLGSANNLCALLRDISSQGINVLMEGSGMTASWRYRPHYLSQNLGFSNILHLRYCYEPDQLDVYQGRIELRSGKPNSGQAMWGKRHAFENDWQVAEKEAIDVNAAGGNVVILYHPYDSSIEDCGEHILDYFGFREYCENFREYCEKNKDYIEKNSFENLKK